MKRVIGYLISIVGLISLALGLEIFNFENDFLARFNKWYITIFGGILIIVGIIISYMDKGRGSRKHSQSEEEVPIYSGTGKHRRIVGYRKD